MRKFAANYLVSEDGVFLKNGMIVAQDDGTTFRITDTKGDLQETEQLIFYNGILMTGRSFAKTDKATTISESDFEFRSFVLESVVDSIQFSMQNLIDLGKRVQVQFPDRRIPSILNEIPEVLLTNGGFTEQKIPGIYLLTSVDLVGLQFTPKSRLRKIF